MLWFGIISLGLKAQGPKRMVTLFDKSFVIFQLYILSLWPSLNASKCRPLSCGSIITLCSFMHQQLITCKFQFVFVFIHWCPIISSLIWTKNLNNPKTTVPFFTSAFRIIQFELWGRLRYGILYFGIQTFHHFIWTKTLIISNCRHSLAIFHTWDVSQIPTPKV